MTERILFVDLDGTVRHGKRELGRFVNTPADVVPFPAAVERMRQWRRDGGFVIGVTNQAGIALGHISRPMHRLIERRTNEVTAGQIDAIFTCHHAPDASCWCRKPNPGLLHCGWRYVLEKTREDSIRRDACLMVGDMATDLMAAGAAGVPFQWAHEWRAEA